MKDFCIVYNKANKTLVKKLVTKLEADGINCWVAPRDYRQDNKSALGEAVNKSKVLLIIIDDKSAKDTELMNALENALENDKSVIPFVISNIESDLYSEHFFYSFSWVDAHEDSFEDAYEILIDAFEDISGESAEEKKSKRVSKNTAKSQSKLLKNKPLLIALSAAVLLIGAYFTYNYFSNEKQSQVLVGEWNLADYQDNMRRVQADSIMFVTKTIPELKKRVLLIFNENNTFERIGFTPEPQIGRWNFNSEKSKLILTPYGAKASANELKIKNLTQSSFTIVAEEEIEDSVRNTNGSYRMITRKSVTKIRFSRKK